MSTAVLTCIAKVKLKQQTQLFPPALTEIQWWRDNAVTLKRHIQHDHPSTTLGWGAVFDTQKTGMRGGEGGGRGERPLRKLNAI